MKKRIKQLFIGIGILLCLLVFLFAVTISYLKTNHALRLIQAKVNDLIPGAILCERHRFSLLKGEFELAQVSLRNPSGNSLAGLDRLFIDLSWTTFLKGDLTVTTLILEGPWADVKIDKKGKINLISAFSHSEAKKNGTEAGKKGGMPININIKSMKLIRGSIHYEVVADDLKASVQDVELTANGNLIKRHGNLNLMIGYGRLDSPVIRTELDGFKLEATLNEDRIDPIILQASAPSSKQLTLSGKIGNIFDSPLLDLAIDISLSLPEVRKAFALKPTLTGLVSTHIKIQGTPDNPQVTFNSAYGGGMLSGQQVDRISIDCLLKDQFLAINSLQADMASGCFNLNGEVDLQDAFMYGFLDQQRDLEAISYRVLLKQKGIRLEKLISSDNPFGGVVDSNLSLHGKGISPQTLSANIAMELSSQDLTTDSDTPPIVFYLKAVAGLEKGIAIVERLEVKADDIKIQTKGNLDLLSKKVEAMLTLDAPNLNGALSAFGLRKVFGMLKLKANVSGSIKHPALDLVIQGDSLRFQDITIGDIQLNTNLDQSGRLDVSQFTLENKGSSIKGSGWAQLFQDSLELEQTLPLNASLVLSHIESKDFFKKELTQGSIDGRLNIRGSLKKPEASLFIQGKDLSVEAARLGDINLGLKFSQGRIYINKMKIHNQSSNINITGKAQIINPETMVLLKDPAFQIKLEGDDLLIEDFVDNFKGKLSIAAFCEGSLSEPKGSVELYGTDLDLGVQKLKAIRLLSRFDGEKVWLSPLDVTIAPREIISIEGWYSLQKTFDLSLVSEGISLHNIDKMREQKIDKGKMVLSISGKGALADPQIEGELKLTNLRINEKSLEDFNLRLDLKDQLALIQGKLNFDLNGSYHLQKKDFSVSIIFNETDLSPYFKMASQPDLSGIMTGKVEVAGNMKAMDDLVLFTDLSKVDVFFREKELVQAQDFKVSFEEKEISIPAFHLMILKEGKLDIKGKGKLNGSLDFDLEGHIPLEVARPFVAEISDISGDILFSAAIGGTRERPDINAEIEMKSIEVTVPVLLQRLHDLNGNIRITPQTVAIDKVKGHLDTGLFELAGKIDLNAFQPVKALIDLSTNALPLQIPDMLDILVTTELKFHGNRKKSIIEGEVVVLEGTYYKDIDLNLIQAVRQKKREESVVLPKEITQPFLKNMSLDISVKRRNPFIVDNNLALLDINLDLRISGNPKNPIISGRATAESGNIYYQKKTFVVKKGYIDFLNPYKIEPTLNIKSEVKVREWIIYLKISGTPDQLVLKLTSDPPEEGDIISLLLLGKTTRELITGEKGSSQSTVHMLAELISSTFGEDIKRATGLDILKLETQREVGDEDTSDRIKVTIGKNLSKRMTLKYATETKDGKISQRAIAKYKFLENILMSGFQDSKGIFGGELQFRLEFR